MGARGGVFLHPQRQRLDAQSSGSGTRLNGESPAVTQALQGLADGERMPRRTPGADHHVLPVLGARLRQHRILAR